VYWIAPHEVLERHGLELILVNTRELARVPGRKKTDRVDCKWIQRLHSCGLLTGSFRPNEAVCMLRTLVRDKGTLVAEAGDWLRRMQKSLDQMNVRVHRAVADIDGVTGMAIIRAIVGGERDARRLAQLRDGRCHKSEDEIAEQLSGHWREDHLFSLKQALKMYDSILTGPLYGGLSPGANGRIRAGDPSELGGYGAGGDPGAGSAKAEQQE
jgi:hypothetical protein